MCFTDLNSEGADALHDLSELNAALNQHAIVAVTDKFGRIIYANDQFCEISKYSRDELVGQDHCILNSGAHPKSFMEKLWKTITSGHTWHGDIKNRAKDGSYYWVSTTIVPLLDAQQIPYRYIAVRTDVTSIKRDQEILRQYTEIINSSNDPIISKTLGGIVTSWNPAAERVLGFSAEEMVGRPLSLIIPPERIAEETDILARIGRGEIVQHFETVRVRKDGQHIFVSVTISPVRDSFGNIVGASKILRDITESKIAESELRASEQRFKQLAENIHEVFWMTDPSKREIIYISPAYEKIWGRKCSTVYDSANAWIEAIHPADRERVVEAAKTKQVSGNYDEVYRIIHSDGEVRWIRDRAYPIKDSSGTVYRIVGTAEDITQQRKLEAQLLQSQKMEAIGTLAGGIAHDFNNILGAINGHAELATFEAGDSKVMTAHLQRISAAGWRAAALVRQILTFSRQQQPDREPIKLAPIIEETVALLRATTPKTITINAKISAKAPMILGDASQIHQVVMNLGTNAVHAMKGGLGTLTIALEEFDTKNGQAPSHVAITSGRYTRLVVSDTGHGMDQLTIQRIYDPFFTTKSQGEGTGLGLAVVHGIVKDHGGEIFAQSTPGKGTEFSVYFPAIDCSDDSEIRIENELPLGNGERILYIDDEETLCILGKTMLERAGYRVDIEYDPLQAIKRIESSLKLYDLIIVDFTMPHMSGTELAQYVVRIDAGIPIILSSGYAEGLTPEQTKSAGIKALLQKPFSYRGLCEAVARVLNGESLETGFYRGPRNKAE